MKIFLLILSFFSFELFASDSYPPFANPCNVTLQLISSSDTYSEVTSYYNASLSGLDGSCGSSTFWGTSCTVSTPTGARTSSGLIIYGRTCTTYTFKKIVACPIGYIKNSLGFCVPPSSCSWAKKPWLPTSRSQEFCFNNEKGNGNEDISYLWNYFWCSADSVCYAKEYYCPAGQEFNALKKQCQPPSTQPTSTCPSGSYKSCGSVQMGNVNSCFCDVTCKDNPKLTHRYEVSCGEEPVDPTPTQDCPTCPQPLDPKTDVSPSTKDHSTKCGTELMLAQSSCVSPNILSFNCDPTTGVVTRNECKLPTVPAPTSPNDGDSTKGATTEDIKNLGNKLPLDIRDALKDYFSDGSMPHLEAIRGSLQSLTTLNSVTNDKLETLTATANAGLNLQSETNSRLDRVNTSIDLVRESLNTEGNGISEEDFLNVTDLDVDTDTKSVLEHLTDNLELIKDQFSRAQGLLSGGVPVLNFGAGSCPSYNFHGVNADLSKIGSSVAPFSSILAILIYITIVFTTFKSAFKFISRGIK